jgi:hypothetical protein
MTTIPAIQFHGYIDAKVARGSVLVPRQTQIVTQDRKLLYTFHPHFHPYVAELVQRLLERSLRGLQAADTEYETPVTLTAQVAATYEDGSAVTLQDQESLRLPDGARIRLSDGRPARLAGCRVVNADDVTVVLDKGATVTLPALTLARRSDGTPVRLSNDTPVILPDGKPRPVFYGDLFLTALYNPAPTAPPDATHGVFVEQPYPVKDLDFVLEGAYAVYNWELFYHVPLMIAIQLSKNQRFEEAQRWFHYIFDPTDDSDQATPERFWKVKPFQTTDVKMIEDILINLSTGEDPFLREETIESIRKWKDSPFRPHVVARCRPSAYMFKTVMAYLNRAS